MRQVINQKFFLLRNGAAVDLFLTLFQAWSLRRLCYHIVVVGVQSSHLPILGKKTEKIEIDEEFLTINPDDPDCITFKIVIKIKLVRHAFERLT